MNTKVKIILGIVTLSMVILFAMVGFPKKNLDPKNVYQVYLNGEKIGLVEDKDELLNLINEEQQDIKDQYKVNQVYPPDGFEILEYVTYDERIASASNIYQKIKNDSNFTIEGYQVTITSPETENEKEKKTIIYVLDEQVYKDAEYRFVTTFVDENVYQAYINNSQEEIKTVGSIIKHMEFEENISIKKAFIPVKEKIFTDVSELTQYLLYGTTEPSSSYVVKQGDTLASIAEASKLNIRELLIANPKYKNESSVLAIGDQLSNEIINPILTLYEEVRVTEDIEQVFPKKTIVDNSLSYGSKKITQTGITGLDRVTQEYRILNGERTQETIVLNSVNIRAAVEEITTVGPSYNPITGPSGGHGGMISTGLSWSWPTNPGYVITTDYEYRWGSFHNALDISGAGNFGSPIYAARGGEVVETYTACRNIGSGIYDMCGGSYGNYIIIRHENNYYTMYAHLKSDLLVSVGSKVSQGQRIASMGSSGSSSGSHVHFGFAIGWPHKGGTWYNPWSLYR